jgi:hypothetical protein
VTQHVDRVHLPPEILQIQLGPPPRQLAGLHPVEEHDGPLPRHTGHSTQDQRWLVTRKPSVRGTPGERVATDLRAESLGIQANAVDRARKPNWLFLGSIASFVGLVLTMIIALADRQTAQDALAR